jgi:Phosphoinositide phospholipase C, Ca2+-dependent
MTTGNTAFHRLQFKASHNSYDRAGDLAAQLLFNSANPALGGCRGLELDLVRKSDSSGGTNSRYFQVNHVAGQTGPHLKVYLDQLRTLHQQDPDHDPVFVTLDIKSTAGPFVVFPDELDTYLRTHFDPALLYTPSHFLRSPGDLVQNAAAHGWPALSVLRGKFIFCLSGTKKWKAYYADKDPAQRLCFADIDVPDNQAATQPPQTGNRIVANMNLFSANVAKWRQSVPRFRAANWLVRGYVLNGSTLWQNALGAGINALATDEVSGAAWATVGSGPYRVS